METNMKLSIIIVGWNVEFDLVQCLTSLRENRPSNPFETIVVDNNSSDDTVAVVKEKFPEVTVIANQYNRGFAAANNQGIEISSGEYVLLLNPDTIVHPKALDILVKLLDEHPDVGACGSKLLNDDGTVQASVRRFPTFHFCIM